MADAKTSALTALTGANTATGDIIPIDDISATTLKGITADELRIAMMALGLSPFGVITRSGYYTTFPAPQSGPTTYTVDTTGSFHRMFFARAVTLDRIGLEITTLVNPSTVRLAIYAQSTTAELPDALILDASTIDSSTTGFKEITISQSVGPGWVWFGVCSSSGSVGIRGAYTGDGPHNTATTISGFTISGVKSSAWTSAGAAPSNAGTFTAGVGQAPRLLVRVV